MIAAVSRLISGDGPPSLSSDPGSRMRKQNGDFTIHDEEFMRAIAILVLAPVDGGDHAGRAAVEQRLAVCAGRHVHSSHRGLAKVRIDGLEAVDDRVGRTVAVEVAAVGIEAWFEEHAPDVTGVAATHDLGALHDLGEGADGWIALQDDEALDVAQRGGRLQKGRPRA